MERCIAGQNGTAVRVLTDIGEEGSQAAFDQLAQIAYFHEGVCHRLFNHQNLAAHHGFEKPLLVAQIVVENRLRNSGELLEVLRLTASDGNPVKVRTMSSAWLTAKEPRTRAWRASEIPAADRIGTHAPSLASTPWWHVAAKSMA